jgi:ankyrin repeat protein
LEDRHEAIVRLLLGDIGIEKKNKRGFSCQNLLSQASRCGRNNVVEFLLDHGVPINTILEDGMAALHIAIQEKHTSTAQRLLDRGANPFLVTEDGRTTLHLAAKYSHDFIRPLLICGANPNARDVEGRTPLHQLSESIDAPNWAADLLLEHGAVWKLQDRHGRTPLETSIKGDAVERFKQIILACNIIESDLAQERYAYLVLAASQYGAIGVLHLLLARGAYLNAIDQDGNTAAHLATKGRHHEVLQLLLESGLAPELLNNINNDGEAALHIAVRQGSFAMTRSLLQHGASQEVRNWNGQTAKDVAGYYNRGGVLLMLGDQATLLK